MRTDDLALTRLMMHVEMPDLEETWLDGYQSGLDDLPEENNPYPMNSQEYECWNEGWWAGFYQEQPLFSLDGTVNPLGQPVQQQTAANTTKVGKTRKYMIRTIQILGTLLAAAICYQLLDLIIS
jgi:ribosome modulation factor